MKHIQGVPRRQMLLFPKAIDDYIEEENPVQFIDAFVDNLRLQAMGDRRIRGISFYKESFC